MSDPERIRGKVVSLYPSVGKYGGSFGEIVADDGRAFTFNNGHVYRNRSHATVGVAVTFQPNGSYATAIDSQDSVLSSQDT